MKALYSIVGSRYVGADRFVRSLRLGTEVMLVRQPDNPNDANAVQVWIAGRHAGYVKREQAATLAPLLDAKPGARAAGRLTIDGSRPAVEFDE